jgi:hypothetical protein
MNIRELFTTRKIIVFLAFICYSLPLWYLSLRKNNFQVKFLSENCALTDCIDIGDRVELCTLKYIIIDKRHPLRLDKSLLSFLSSCLVSKQTCIGTLSNCTLSNCPCSYFASSSNFFKVCFDEEGLAHSFYADDKVVTIEDTALLVSHLESCYNIESSIIIPL